MATAKTPKAPEAAKIQKVEEAVKAVKTAPVEKVEKETVKTVKTEPVEKVEKKAVKAEKKVEKKAAAKPAAQKVEEVVIQFGGAEWTEAQLKQAAQDAYVAEGHRASTIKKLTVYVKPEERMAYYVVNEKVTGNFAI